MKLLLDQNISFRVVKLIENNFPGSKSVRELGLENTKDIEIWNFAKSSGFIVVTFDIDFIDIAVLKGIPPSIICLRTGNTSTIQIAEKLNRLTNIDLEGIYQFEEHFFRKII